MRKRIPFSGRSTPININYQYIRYPNNAKYHAFVSYSNYLGCVTSRRALRVFARLAALHFKK